MNEKKGTFDTDELVEFIKWIRTDITDSNTSAFDAIIARLRAADRLCEAAREYLAGGEEFQGNDLDKAIADYEGKE